MLVLSNRDGLTLSVAAVMVLAVVVMMRFVGELMLLLLCDDSVDAGDRGAKFSDVGESRV